MLVKIKTLAQLEKEFGYDNNGSINCYQTFAKHMFHICNKIIEVENSRFGFSGIYEYFDSVNNINLSITNDMISEWLLSEQDKIELMKNL
jgi:hypothetical protein